MNIDTLITMRNIDNSAHYDLVYEWEDIFAKSLDADFINDNPIRLNKLLKFLHLNTFFTTFKKSFRFNMLPNHNIGYNKRNIIPLIIDFYLSDQDLPQFYKMYDKNRVVLISNKEVFDHLKEIGCPLNIQHLALSIPDKYAITPEKIFKKEYDLALMGRQNPIMEKYLQKYVETHPSLMYVYRKLENGKFNYYTSNGSFLGEINNRDGYMGLMRKCKIGLYATPGIDGGEKYTNGYNQVTPRFLEYIACGCHVIARYPDNADTDYYDLSSVASKVESYQQFEAAMDMALSTSVDMIVYSNYLARHYTSRRVKEFLEIIGDLS